MICYFSGNGNSRWVARQLAAALHVPLCDISACLKDPSAFPSAALQRAGSVGLVFPVHSWRAPAPVFTFLARFLPASRLSACCYRYAVCTCGDDAGKTMNHLSKHFPLNAAWSVTMPNTYIPMFQLDSDTLAGQKLASARHRLPEIASAVAGRQSVWQVHEGALPRMKTYAVHPLFTRFVISSHGFHADEGCTACGTCARRCPVGNIRLADGHPEWGNSCIHCMACVHGCPQGVVQYRRATQQRGRYRLTDYLDGDLP